MRSALHIWPFPSRNKADRGACEVREVRAHTRGASSTAAESDFGPAEADLQLTASWTEGCPDTTSRVIHYPELSLAHCTQLLSQQRLHMGGLVNPAVRRTCAGGGPAKRGSTRGGGGGGNRWGEGIRVGPAKRGCTTGWQRAQACGCVI